MQALGCVVANERGENQPTVAGLVLFGNAVALRRCLPTTRVDYIRVPGTEWLPDPERRFDSIDLRDSLLRLIRRAQAAILDDLPKAFGLAEGDLQRKDSPVVPQRVIREAVVNALMHRSYRSHAPIQIIRYSNRLEIRNPGHSLKLTCALEIIGEHGATRPGRLLRRQLALDGRRDVIELVRNPRQGTEISAVDEAAGASETTDLDAAGDEQAARVDTRHRKRRPTLARFTPALPDVVFIRPNRRCLVVEATGDRLGRSDHVGEHQRHAPAHRLPRSVVRTDEEVLDLMIWIAPRQGHGALPELRLYRCAMRRRAGLARFVRDRDVELPIGV